MLRGSMAVLARSSHTVMASRMPHVHERIAPSAPGVHAPTARPKNRSLDTSLRNGATSQKPKHQITPSHITFRQYWRYSDSGCSLREIMSALNRDRLSPL